MDLNKLTKKELVDYADSKGISVNIKDKKEVLISKIKSLDNSTKVKTKKDPWWAAIGGVIIFVLAAKYLCFPALVFFKSEILFVAIIIAYFSIGGWIESKISSDPDSNWTIIIGGIIAVCYVVWGISWSIQNPYG
jgi:hypothetical protein